MKIPTDEELRIRTLGAARLPSPLRGRGERFMGDDDRVLCLVRTRAIERLVAAGQEPPALESAGPREQLYFDPAAVKCGIVTCGGLCPGLNDVIRSITLSLHFTYGVRQILGFRYGYSGLVPDSPHQPLELTPDMVAKIHRQGGTLLGTSRGPQSAERMVDRLVELGVNVLFTIGGDGTLKGALKLVDEIERRGLDIAVVGVPKTIDNDISWIWRSFGYGTAVEEGSHVLKAAHNEARGAWNGVGLVKLMGRHSGFIAAEATLANGDVNYCLIPESPFTLEGRGGLLDHLERRLDERQHAVIAVAEGAGQDVLEAPGEDASGNRKLADIGVFLRDRIVAHFKERGIEITVKYIDPSYTIRSVPANPLDSAYCLLLGQHAVHAGLSGRTGLLVGYWNQAFVHIPIAVACAERRQVDVDGEVWQRVLQATGQPTSLVGTPG